MLREIRITKRFFICYAIAILVTASGYVHKDLVWLSEFVFGDWASSALLMHSLCFYSLKNPSMRSITKSD